MSDYRPGLFAVETLPGTFAGFAPQAHANGWALPLFPRDVAERIAAAYAAQPDEGAGPFRARYDAEQDAFVVYDPYGDITETYGAQQIEIGDQVLIVYPFATGTWTWEEVGTPTSIN